MRSLFLLVIIVVGYGMIDTLGAEVPVAPGLINTLVKTDTLSPSDKAFLDRRRSNPSVKWAVPVTVDPDALNHRQLDVFLYDQHVRILESEGRVDSRSGNVWYGKVVLPDDPPAWAPGSLRDVRVVRLANGGIFATIRVDGFVYQVTRLDSGTQVLSKQDLSRLYETPNDILFPHLRIEPASGQKQEKRDGED